MLYSLLAFGLYAFVTIALPIDNAGLGAKLALRTTNSKRELYGDTSNELALCRPVTIIFARGTAEPGNIGLLAGPPFFDALAAQIGDAIAFGVQGVPYAADIVGYLEGGDPTG